MKKRLTNYYGIIVIGLFILNNLILVDLKIQGTLYNDIMLLLSILNSSFLLKRKEEIKCKNLMLIISYLLLFFSKNIYNFIFIFLSLTILMITGCLENMSTRIITIIIIVFTSIFHLLLLFVFLLKFGSETNDIYEDTHYICGNNTHIYTYSLGAMDSFHYSIGKHYEILNINDIINIEYKERNEKTKEEYDNYLKNHKCILVGDNNESK